MIRKKSLNRESHLVSMLSTGEFVYVDKSRFYRHIIASVSEIACMCMLTKGTHCGSFIQCSIGPMKMIKNLKKREV